MSYGQEDVEYIIGVHGRMDRVGIFSQMEPQEPTTRLHKIEGADVSASSLWQLLNWLENH